MVGYKVGQCLRTHRLVGMSCPSRFPVYERNLRETGNVSQQSQCDDKLLFIRVMSPRCSWHCLCHTHIYAQRASGGRTLNVMYVNAQWTAWKGNGNVSLSTSFPLWTHILIYRDTHGCLSFSFFPKGLWDSAYITPAGSRGRNAMAGAECSEVLECAVGKYERGKKGEREGDENKNERDSAGLESCLCFRLKRVFRVWLYCLTVRWIQWLKLRCQTCTDWHDGLVCLINTLLSVCVMHPDDSVNLYYTGLQCMWCSS